MCVSCVCLCGAFHVSLADLEAHPPGPVQDLPPPGRVQRGRPRPAGAEAGANASKAVGLRGGVVFRQGPGQVPLAQCRRRELGQLRGVLRDKVPWEVPGKGIIMGSWRAWV